MLTSTLPSRHAAPGVLLFGLECATTRIVLDHLIAGGIDVRLVCMPGPPAVPLIEAPARRRPASLPFAAPAMGTPTVTAAAHGHGIDVWRIGDLRSKRVERALAGVDADALVVACYDRLIPAAIYGRLPLGGLNLHPSLLPDKRGPDPLFWVFHAGDELAGVTIHRLTETFDAGDILAQQSIPLPDGISEDELDALLAAIGAELVIDCLAQLSRGEPTTCPQNDEAATWAPLPQPCDWVIDGSWTARRAFNFVRGVGGRGHPISLRCDGEQRQVVEVLDWQADDQAVEAPPGAVAVPMSEGILVARFAPRHAG